MKLRTVTGQRWPAKCADGCGATIPPGESVKLVVDLDSKPRKAWLPEHSPDAGTWNRGRGRAGPSGDPENPPPQTSRPIYPTPAQVPPPERTPPARSSPASTSPSRDPPPSPPNVSIDVHQEEGDPQDFPTNARAWAAGQISLRESSLGFCRVTFGARAHEGETDEALRSRVNRALLADLEVQVSEVRRLRERLGIEPGPATSRSRRGAA